MDHCFFTVLTDAIHKKVFKIMKDKKYITFDLTL